jgi:hypothetical protein
MIQTKICRWVRYIFNNAFKPYNNTYEFKGVLQFKVHIVQMSSLRLGISYCFGLLCSTRPNILSMKPINSTHILYSIKYFLVHFFLYYLQ